MHIVWTVATVVFMTLAIGFGAVVSGRRFRVYSLATLLIMVTFGIMTGLDAPKLEADLPTPWLGVWERISVGASMLWMAVLAITLLRVVRVSSQVPIARATM